MVKELASNSSVSHYRIVSKIGAGGMGEVYLAQDTKLDRKVALKILPADVAANQERMGRFVQEAKSASALNHPNILTIHEIGAEGNTRFIATEFIDGETLRARLKRERIKLDEVLDIAQQTAFALTSAHAAGIVHRDIKPENIMLRRDGIVKVLDFGLAKLTERPPELVDTEGPTSIKTDPGTIVGTAVYMSPEQARGMPVDARTDIFSLSVVLYEMVAGHLPFEGSTSSEVLASILSEKEPQPLARYSREVPAELERIVSKALRKNRDQRYQTIQDLLLDLKSLMQELEFEKKLERSAPQKSKSEVETREPEGAETVMGSAARSTLSERGATSAIRINKGRVVIAVAALLIIASAAGAYFYFTRARTRAINSIAVLPFINASGNSEVEYLADGLTESLITSLSQLPKLSVKARSSVFRYKGKDTPPQQVGKELNGQAILNGRVVQRGNDLTLHIELVDVNTETALWGGDYDRSMTNLVSLAGEIARDVSSKLRLKLSSPDEQRLAKNYPANTEAYQLYLKGRYHLAKLMLTETQKGISYFQQAIAIDPNYALAYVGLADGNRALTLSGEMPSTEYMPKAKAAAQKAIEIDDTLAEAHASLGFINMWYDWDWHESEKQCRRAIELNPNSSDAHLNYAHLLSVIGRHAEGLAEAKRARELDPLNLRTSTLEGQFLLHAGQTDEALARLQKTIGLDPNFWFAHGFAASAFIEKGMFVEAVAEARKARELNSSAHAASLLGYALAKSGKQGEARAVLEELLKLSTQRYIPPYHIAMIYNGLGDRDETFTWLERGFNERDPRMIWLKGEPKWNHLHADPRFQDLLRRVGFPQ
jgi:serine/threonine protein kinase/Tfp pilus assembly protein PilF